MFSDKERNLVFGIPRSFLFPPIHQNSNIDRYVTSRLLALTPQTTYTTPNTCTPQATIPSEGRKSKSLFLALRREFRR